VQKVMDVVTHAPTETAVRQTMGERIAKPENIAIIRKAMVGVNIEGTSARAFQGAPYTSGGKTGTAQVVTIKQGEKYHASQVDERHRDHALFTAYAPAEDPKIAIAMIVENAGFGAQAAAPIARRAFDYLLMGQYPSEEDSAAVQQAKATTPIGKPRNVADVAWPIGAPASAASAASAPQAAASASAPASAPASRAAATASAARTPAVAAVAKPASGTR
jgi:penicillin-binding protein 2